jgi:hypothetical protein
MRLSFVFIIAFLKTLTLKRYDLHFPDLIKRFGNNYPNPNPKQCQRQPFGFPGSPGLLQDSTFVPVGLFKKGSCPC